MIVKNEMADLERCLGAVAPYIACWVIGDTGSTDGTQDSSARSSPPAAFRAKYTVFHSRISRRRVMRRFVAPAPLNSL